MEQLSTLSINPSFNHSQIPTSTPSKDHYQDHSQRLHLSLTTTPSIEPLSTPSTKPSFNPGQIPTIILSTNQQSSALRTPSNLPSKVTNRVSSNRASFYRPTTE